MASIELKITQYAGCKVLCVLYGIDMIMSCTLKIDHVISVLEA